MSRLVIAALTVLVAVFGLLGAAAWNRAGDPQVITLTERELSLPWTWENGRDDDDAELRLSFVWERRDDPLDARSWLIDERLRELGFSTAVLASAPEAARFYGRGVPRLGFVVLELGGAAWQLMERRRETNPPRPGARPGPGIPPSRLVPIDAGPELAPLLARHRGQIVLVLPAVFSTRWQSRKEGAVVYGRVDSLVSPDVGVPRRLRDRLAGLRRGLTTARYEVDVAVGRLGAPWILDVRR